MGKDMEGDNIQRRGRARRARQDARVSPGTAQVTLGASKAREHLPEKANHTERAHSKVRGKQRSGVDRGPSRR